VQGARHNIRVNYEWLLTTYDLSLAILFLDRLDNPQDRKLIRLMAFRLLTGQQADGGWSYNCSKLTEKDQEQLESLLKENALASPLELKPVDLSKLAAAGPGALAPTLKNLAVLGTPPKTRDQAFAASGADNSNTQFAFLALWAARRHGVPLDRTLALLAHRFRTSQGANGGWSYYYRGQETSTMTCAGLLGMAVDQGLINEAQGKKKGTVSNRAGRVATQDPIIKKGIAYLSQFAGKPTGSWANHGMVNLYLLWSLERVAVIYRLPKIGDKEWYPWGAEILVANQKPEGNWQGGLYPGSDSIIDTCLALLFLKRANLAKDLTAKLQMN
jgi:hypothetical protein